MAPRPTNQQAAESIVGENLGIDLADVGVDSAALGDDIAAADKELIGEDAGDEGGELQAEDGGQEQTEQGDQGEQQLDDLQPRVTHTPQQQRQQPKPFPRNAEVKPDQRGNLVNAQGQIVAKAGKEARLYMDASNAKRELARSSATITDLQSRVERAVEIGQGIYSQFEKLKAENAHITKLGLAQSELLDAATIAAEAKANPVGALKKLLTRAAANGIDLTQLGLAGGSDPKALMDMVRNEINTMLKPLNDRMAGERQQGEQNQQRQAALRATTEKVTQFFGQNPDAAPFLPVFQEVLKQPAFRHMSLGEIWARIQLNQLRNNAQPRQPNRQQPRIPSGGRGSPSPQGGNRAAPAQIDDPSRSYDDILRDVMASAGIV